MNLRKVISISKYPMKTETFAVTHVQKILWLLFLHSTTELICLMRRIFGGRYGNRTRDKENSIT